MKKNDIRICDVCGKEISRDENYHVIKIKPEAAEIFFRVREIELMPTWTQNPDGTVSFDICLDCYYYMGYLSNSDDKN